MVRVLYLLGGLIFLAVAIGAMVAPSRERRRYERAVQTRAQLVEVEVEQLDEGPIFHPVVRFTAGPQNETVTAKTTVPEYAGKRMISGSTVTIRYDPQAPTTVWIVGHRSDISLLGVALLLLFAAAMLYQVLR